jgi:hypothetical protein
MNPESVEPGTRIKHTQRSEIWEEQELEPMYMRGVRNEANRKREPENERRNKGNLESFQQLDLLRESCSTPKPPKPTARRRRARREK